MGDREKLIGLVHNARMNALWHNAQKPSEYITDMLIEDGVTVRERGRWETTEVTEDWESVETYRHLHRECKYSYCDNGLGGHYFCPNCGAKMDGERK